MAEALDDLRDSLTGDVLVEGGATASTSGRATASTC
jgi:hypothetical protein